LFHLVPRAQLERQVQAGKFNTLETCDKKNYIQTHGYAKPYEKSAMAGQCMVFWDKKSAKH
jgi:hypothetical protein